MNARDKISELPAPILHHIMSYLPITDAARTCVLSKCWNKVWQTLPYLDLNYEDDDDFYTNFSFNDLFMTVKEMVKSRREKHQVSIQKFTFSIPLFTDDSTDLDDEELSDELNSWCLEVISFMRIQSLREFELVNGLKWNGDLLSLPPILLSAERLTHLTLNGFDLSSSWSSSSCHIKFTCLKNLMLDYVSLDDSLLKDLIFSCRSTLKNLALRHCFDLKTICLGAEFVELKGLRVDINLCEEDSVVFNSNPSTNACMEILEVGDLPKLKTIEVHGFHILELKNFKVENCVLLKSVILDYDFITDDHVKLLLASCKQIQCLTITSSFLLNNIHVSNQSLKTLFLSSLKNLNNIHISSHVKTLFLSNLKNLKNFHILSPFPKKLEFQIHLDPPNVLLNDYDGGVHKVKLSIDKIDVMGLKFLSNFKHIQVIKLWITSFNNIIPEYTKEMSPLYGTRDISIQAKYEELMALNLTKVVEFFLWLAPRAERVSIVSFVALELEYSKNNEEKENFNCKYCKLLPVDCWRHCLKEVKINISETSRSETSRSERRRSKRSRSKRSGGNFANLKDFFLKNVENLKIEEIEYHWDDDKHIHFFSDMMRFD